MPHSPTPDSWQHLKQYTAARIALGRAGSSLSTAQLLDFQLAHAQARDAVHAALDINQLQHTLTNFSPSVLTLASQATTRLHYLQRPDLGRRLAEASVSKLKQLPTTNYDLTLVVADGLSACAIHKNIEPLFHELIPKITTAAYRLAPLCIVEQGRVAVGDEIAYLLNSRIVIIFIGERPGLSSPDSLGIYLTYQPQVGLTDEMRNCISNVRFGGLPYAFAAEKLFYLVQESFRKKLSGVHLRDNLNIELETKDTLPQKLDD
jgi:ethanolamine ammonia-lyase small subunit